MINEDTLIQIDALSQDVRTLNQGMPEDVEDHLRAAVLFLQNALLCAQDYATCTDCGMDFGLHTSECLEERDQ